MMVVGVRVGQRLTLRLQLGLHHSGLVAVVLGGGGVGVADGGAHLGDVVPIACKEKHSVRVSIKSFK